MAQDSAEAESNQELAVLSTAPADDASDDVEVEAEAEQKQMKIAVTPSNEDHVIDIHQMSLRSDSNGPSHEAGGAAGGKDTTKSTRPMLKSTLKKQQRSWIDPYEPAIQDTFYHKELKQLRPNFDNVQMAITKMNTELNELFAAGPIFDDNDSNLNGGAYRNPDEKDEDAEVNAIDNKTDDKGKGGSKFGAWDGVFAGCILNIFGVIMFLRVGWIVGQAGIVQAIGIMLISSLVTFLTTLSMSAICTNGTILSGGAYYIISRALGPSIGAAVGVMFSIGNMVAVAMYLIGFAETLVDNLGDPILTGSKVGDVRIWSNLVLVFCLILALVGLKYVIKANLGLFVLIIVTICCFFIGSFYRTKGSGDDQVIYGFKGWTNNNFSENLSSTYVDGYDFFGVLSIFFPAVTGIMAGANISGDLKNPSKDIPKGTLTAVAVSTVTYCLMALFVGAVAKRSELLDEYLVMTDIAVWDGIILIGIYAATLSSGIAALVGAPRILQAVAQDNIIPILSFFAVTDKNGNPVRGYFLSFFVAACCNCIGELNFVAPLISEFFMIAYLMINFACFALEISKSPGWRPSFRYYNKYSCLLGSLLCLGVMFLIDWRYAVIAVLIGISIFLYVEFTEPQIKWGSAQASRIYYEVYKALLRLRTQKLHIKNWRPAILTLTHDPLKHPQLVLFSQTLKKGYGPLFFGTIYKGDYRINIQKFHHAHNDGYLPKMVRPGTRQQYYHNMHNRNSSRNSKNDSNYLQPLHGVAPSVSADHDNEVTATATTATSNSGSSGGGGGGGGGNSPGGNNNNNGNNGNNGQKQNFKFCKGFYEAILADNFRSGAQNLFQLVGVGNLRPNTIMIGFKKRWRKEDKSIVNEYVQVLRDALQMRMGLIICHGFEKINWAHFEFVPCALPIDYSNDNDANYENEFENEYKGSKIIQGPGSEAYMNNNNNNNNNNNGDNNEEAWRTHSQNVIALNRNAEWNMGQSLPIIDVWWLLDDGGLTMLLPYIMQLHNFWKMCQLRMNLVADKDDIINTDVALIENLILKFRLPYGKPRVILANNNEPTKHTISKFEKMAGISIDKTPRPSVAKRWLKLSELLFEHSRYSGIIVVTLPLPTATFDSKAYMALLNCISDQKMMPPTMIMRGNGESSLTFYSE